MYANYSSSVVIIVGDHACRSYNFFHSGAEGKILRVCRHVVLGRRLDLAAACLERIYTQLSRYLDPVMYLATYIVAVGFVVVFTRIKKSREFSKRSLGHRSL